jgi:EF-P beta-lysylation protein EpmB
MITATPLARHTSAWQRDLAAAITDPRELLATLELPLELLPQAQQAAVLFALRVPRSFVRRMRRGDVADPLLLQVLPLSEELAATPGYVADPLQEADAIRAAGLLHKYQGRALLIATGACAVHCRYCFRREFPYAEQHSAKGRWREAIQHVATDVSIEELILSGGDPLSLSDTRLQEITDSLQGIAHLRRLRIHTRQPIVLPSRVDDSLLRWLAGLRWPVVIVLHVNHANEIDDEVVRALAALRNAGATLLNQSVLLRGVNDNVVALEALSKRLFDCGVLPYYLHLTDAVRGTAHFAVSDAQGQVLLNQLAARLPGYLLPRLVREMPMAAAKVSISGGLRLPEQVRM